MERKRKKNDLILMWLGIGLVLISIYFFFTGFETSRDGVVEGRLMTINSRARGEVLNLYVEDNQEVKKGDLLLEIDSQVYVKELRDAESELNHAKVRLLMCEKPDREDIVISDEKPTKSLIDSKYGFARSDLDRFAKMFSGNVQKRRDKLVPSKPKPVTETPKPATVSGASIELAAVGDVEEEDYAMVDTVELREEIKALESKVANCKLNLSYTKVYATRDGVISSIDVKSGDFVEVGQTLIGLIPKRVWVVANYKSSQADKMHEGQNVYIKIEDYPRKIFKGMVESVDSTATMDGAESTDTDVDTVPVRIVFTKDYSEYNIVPGMATTTSVKVK